MSSSVPSWLSQDFPSYNTPKRKYDMDDFPTRGSRKSSYPAYTPGVKRNGELIVTQTPKNNPVRQKLKQTTISFSKGDSLSLAMPSPSSRPRSSRPNPSISDGPTSISEDATVFGLDFGMTLTTLTVSECLSVKVEANSTAILSSPDRGTSKQLSFIV